jgi:hypothetical protein
MLLTKSATSKSTDTHQAPLLSLRPRAADHRRRPARPPHLPFQDHGHCCRPAVSSTTASRLRCLHPPPCDSVASRQSPPPLRQVSSRPRPSSSSSPARFGARTRPEVVRLPVAEVFLQDADCAATPLSASSSAQPLGLLLRRPSTSRSASCSSRGPPAPWTTLSREGDAGGARPGWVPRQG